MTNNSLANNLYDLGELMASNLNTVGVSDADVDDGLTTLANKILNAGVEKIPTILTLNTPLVVYTDLFSVTGTLTDGEENPISGATIQLIWNDGTEHIATGSTNSSGVFSFTSTDPASVSSYSFQLFFAGDSDYAQSNSSVVNVNTSKETSVLVITSPASGSTVSTDSVTVSGTLEDNDGTAMSGKSIEYLLNGSSAGSATVGSDGSFSKTVSGLSAGSNSIRCAISATTTHTAANQLITVNRSTFDGLADLELIDGSQILSYADEQSTPNSQYATVETQLTNSGSPALIEGVTVDFYRYVDGVNDVYLDSVDTDSSGQADYTYHSAGIGDIKIYGKVGSFVTETYSIKDAIYSDDMTSANQNWVFNNVTPSYSSDGVTVTPNAGTTDKNAHLDLTSSYDGDYEVSAIVTCTTYPKPFLCPYNCMAFVNNSHLLVLADMNTGYSGYSSVANFQDSNTMHHRFTVIGNTVTLYVNNVQVLQKTVANPSEIIQLWFWDNTYTIKDVLVMPL